MPAKRLVIISHTPHYEQNGVYYGWGPTIKEINRIAPRFESVIHFAPLHGGALPASNLPYTQPNIRYIKLRAAGGENIVEKLKLFLLAPLNVSTILKELKTTDWIQLRAPSNIAFIMLPVLSIFRQYHKWVKYAGNWDERSPALTYQIQRWWLKKNIQGSKVTVNGKWPNDGKHILAFENPCMDESELKLSKAEGVQKEFNDPINICFVGQLDDNKGVLNLIQSLSLFNGEDLAKINKIAIVGDGPLMATLKEKQKEININIELLGYLNHDEIGKVYNASHINILPSKSEGFPKVIAEGAAYGCIPVVTNVSSLSQYINDANGVLLPDNSPASIHLGLKKIFDKPASERKGIAMNATSMADKFTYEHYIQRVFAEIIEKSET